MSKHNKKDWSKFNQEHDNEATQHEELFEKNYEEEIPDEEPAISYTSDEDLKEKLLLAEQKAYEYGEKSVRAAAELENVRRRMEREVANAHKYGMEKLITALLPVVDSLDQALQIAEKNSDTAMYEGLELTMKLCTDVFQKFGVESIDPIGEPFDPQQHEAMSIQDVPGAAPNSVIAVFQKGYKLNDRVIRAARVIVSKK